MSYGLKVSSLVLVFLMLVMLLVPSCAIPATPPVPKPAPLPPMRNDAPGKPSYLPGEPIEVRFSWKNLNAIPMKVAPFPFAVEFRNADNIPVRYFPGGPGEYTINPGETLDHSITWDQRDSAGRNVPPGYYLVAVQWEVSDPKLSKAPGYPALRVLVQFPQGAVNKTVRPAQAKTLQDGSRLVLDELELSPVGAKARARLTPTGYVGPASVEERGILHPSLDGGSARYRIDGGPWSSLRFKRVSTQKDFIALEWDLINPVPKGAKSLDLVVEGIKFEYFPNNKLTQYEWAGPFQFSVALD
ncbi:MAG: hypothetical protein HY665_08685 [Chloroflexi bacterium]|nr:hypothetical protein [Chloroflexota bacterium]